MARPTQYGTNVARRPRGAEKNYRGELIDKYGFCDVVVASQGFVSPCMGAVAKWFGFYGKDAFKIGKKGKLVERRITGSWPKGAKRLNRWEDIQRAVGAVRFKAGDTTGEFRFGEETPPNLFGLTGSPKRKMLGKTVGQTRPSARKFCKEQLAKFPIGHIVGVRGHVLALNCKGETIVDTNPRKSDRRKVVHFRQITILNPFTQKELAAKRAAKPKRKKAKKAEKPRKLKRCPKGKRRNPKTRRCVKK